MLFNSIQFLFFCPAVKGLAHVSYAQFEQFETTVRFDVVTLFSVLAQLNDPLETLLRIRKCLVPGGRIFLCDVNFDGFYAATVGGDHLSNVPPLHKNFYTAKTMVRLLASAGFGDIEVETPGQLDVARVWMYWEQGRRNGWNEALYQVMARELEAASGVLQDLIVASKASEHMWVTATPVCLGDGV